MGRHLRDRDVQRIVEILDGWKSELTWEALVQTCQKRLDLQPVRQTLYRSMRIREAYELAKARVRSDALSVPLPSSLRAAGERIVRLEAENARLRRENDGLMGQFVIWQYNAHLRGMFEAELNCPLPEVDLGLTQRRKNPRKGI
ncbi:hypothetical protein [Xanthomonas sp. 3307]|uniref:hypothetical protein n=1 Tax=Xanthomonas sp. 3307 TaxID=3035316 RepID=UPI001611C52D|nr:hypothetical protein [Xanthomonas sp. 3307]MBB5940797.1 hypothetical protein [Xanthomonas sp. 3307]